MARHEKQRVRESTRGGNARDKQEPKKRLSPLKWAALLVIVGGLMALVLVRPADTGDEQPKESEQDKEQRERAERVKIWKMMDSQQLLQTFVDLKSRADEGDEEAAKDMKIVEGLMQEANREPRRMPSMPPRPGPSRPPRPPRN